MAKKGLDYMMEYVREYLRGDMQRMFFDLDFNYYLTENYPAMERKNPEMAECFVFYLLENGVACSDSLSDAQHKKLIRRQFKAFDALNGGLW